MLNNMTALQNLHADHFIHIHMHLRAHKLLLWLRIKQPFNDVSSSYPEPAALQSDINVNTMIILSVLFSTEKLFI